MANLADTGVLSNELFIDKKLFEIRKEKGEAPNPGDLVFTAVGTLGKCYVVKDGDIFFCKDTNTLRFSEHNQYSYYLRLLFQTPYIQKLIKETAIGSTVRNLTIGVMNNWLIPVPSIEEQHRIVTKINQLFEQIDHAEKAYKELSGPLSERFRQLCLEKAIQGKLVPQLGTNSPRIAFSRIFCRKISKFIFELLAKVSKSRIQHLQLLLHPIQKLIHVEHFDFGFFFLQPAR